MFLEHLANSFNVDLSAIKKLKKETSLEIDRPHRLGSKRLLWCVCNLVSSKEYPLRNYLEAFEYRLSLRTKKEVQALWDKYKYSRGTIKFDEFSVPSDSDIEYARNLVSLPTVLRFLKSSGLCSSILDLIEAPPEVFSFAYNKLFTDQGNLTTYEKRATLFVIEAKSIKLPKGWRYTKTKENFIRALFGFRQVLNIELPKTLTWPEIAFWRMGGRTANLKDFSSFEKYCMTTNDPVAEKIYAFTRTLFDDSLPEELRSKIKKKKIEEDVL